jgi:uncharacterized membrane protein YdjX (TVP38/TMEM64 family)
MADPMLVRRLTGTTQRWLLLVATALVAVLAVVGFGDFIRLEYLATREVELRALRSDHPILVFVVAFLIYVAVTGLSIPGATVLSLVSGWYFGFLAGMVLVSFASTAGATVAFLLSRFLFREAVRRRFHGRLQNFTAALDREGPLFLFTLRLIPVVPFFVVNVVMGLTPMATRTFWWISQLGMLPGTAVYLYAGSQVPTLQTLVDRGPRAIVTPQLAIALGLLGALPLLGRGALWLIRAARARTRPSAKVTP